VIAEIALAQEESFDEPATTCRQFPSLRTRQSQIHDHDGVLPNSPLTPRESEDVELLAERKSNKEVASTLGVSMRTIESHRNHIMHKMNFASFSELIRFALRSRVVER
jgi:DNA-binding CsgD family transcriptional regulator